MTWSLINTSGNYTGYTLGENWKITKLTGAVTTTATPANNSSIANYANAWANRTTLIYA